MDVAGESHLLHGLLFRHAEDQHRLGAFDAQDAIDGGQGSVGGIQHSSRGHGRAGQGLDGAARLQVDAHELLSLVRGQPAGAETAGLGERGVADLRAGHNAVGANTQGHSHGASIAAGGRDHAVADGLAVLLGFHQGRDAAALGDGHFNILVRSHHRAESFTLGGHGKRLDGALGDGVGASQGQRSDQADDRQHQKCGHLLLLSRIGHGSLPPSGSTSYENWYSQMDHLNRSA